MRIYFYVIISKSQSIIYNFLKATKEKGYLSSSMLSRIFVVSALSRINFGVV